MLTYFTYTSKTDTNVYYNYSIIDIVFILILRITGSDTNSFGLTSDASFLTVKYIGLINMNRLYYGIVFIEHDHRKCKPMVVVKVFKE